MLRITFAFSLLIGSLASAEEKAEVDALKAELVVLRNLDDLSGEQEQRREEDTPPTGRVSTRLWKTR